MPSRRRAPRAAALIFGLTACVCAACGGGSVGAKATPTPFDPEALAAITRLNQAWADFKDGPGQFLDRDFFDCYQLNNVPLPSVPTPEDPSGHSRGRRDCTEALQAVVAALPQYDQMAADAKAVTVPATSPQRAQFEAVVKARTARADWAHAVAAAFQANDTDKLQTLRRQIPEIEALESAALGIDLSKVGTPAPRPTLPYIPGVPTATPQRR
jgi:hypothetical protein